MNRRSRTYIRRALFKRCQILSTYKPAANFNQLEKAGNQLQFQSCQILKKAAILGIIYIENEKGTKI